VVARQGPIIDFSKKLSVKHGFPRVPARERIAGIYHGGGRAIIELL
jgi:hypothetical protein